MPPARCSHRRAIEPRPCAPDSPNAVGRHAFPGDLHGKDHSVRVEMELVDADRPMVAIRLAEGPAMVDDVPLARRRMDYGVMAGAGRHGRVLLENLSHSLERPERGAAYGV